MPQKSFAAWPRHKQFRGLAATQKERAKGLEPSTSSLGSGRGVVLSPADTALTASHPGRCTGGCTCGSDGALGQLPSPPAGSSITDPELMALTQAWPTLSPAIRAGILAMVKASGG